MVRKKSVAVILTKRVQESRSPLYRWLAENYDQIAPILARQTRPAWEALARTVEESSTLPRPTRQGVKKAWLRLEQDKQQGQGRAIKSPPAAQARLNTSPTPTSPSEPAAEDEEHKPRFQRKSVAMRGVPTPNKEE